MQDLMIIAHTWQGLAPSVETFYLNDRAVKFVGELVSGVYDIKPDPSKDCLEYIQDYYKFVREENDNMCEVDVTLKIIRV